MKVKSLLILSGIVSCLLLFLANSRVIAAAFPSETPLHYSGQLTDAAGTPQLGVRDFLFEMYSSNLGGSLLCSSVFSSVDLTAANGNFRLPLPQECADAVAQVGEVFAQVTVGTVTLPRQKIGAVPFAVSARESQRANTADVSTTTLTVADGAVSTAALVDGSVTPAKAPFAPIILTRNGQIQNPRIFFGTGSLTASGQTTTATGTISIAAAGFSSAPIQCFCSGAQIPAGSPATAECSAIDNSTVRVTVRSPCSTIEICGGVKFNFIAVGQ
jgi:hypothetical protein